MRFRGEVRWFYLPPTLLKCVRIGEKADCPHAVHTVLLLRNPLRIRRHRRRPRRRLPQPSPSSCLYPSPPSLQHHSSRSVFLIPPFLITSPCYSSQSHYNSNTLQQKSSILPYKSRKTYGRIYPSNFFFRDRQKERKGNTRLDSNRNLSGTVDGLVLLWRINY